MLLVLFWLCFGFIFRQGFLAYLNKNWFEVFCFLCKPATAVSIKLPKFNFSLPFDLHLLLFVDLWIAAWTSGSYVTGGIVIIIAYFLQSPQFKFVLFNSGERRACVYSYVDDDKIAGGVGAVKKHMVQPSEEMKEGTNFFITFAQTAFAVGAMRGAYLAYCQVPPGDTRIRDFAQQNNLEWLFSRQGVLIKQYLPGICAEIGIDHDEQLVNDLELQYLARKHAHMYNKALESADDEQTQVHPRVFFVPSVVIEVEGYGKLFVEPFLQGVYTKWNNNFGFVAVGDALTPQAFSHFTYEKSEKELMIVDLQGVVVFPDEQTLSSSPSPSAPGSAAASSSSSSSSSSPTYNEIQYNTINGGDKYKPAGPWKVFLLTDPQTHLAPSLLTRFKSIFKHKDATRKFGAGQMASEGMSKFIESHSCNDICKRLSLPHIEANTVGNDNNKNKPIWKEMTELIIERTRVAFVDQTKRMMTAPTKVAFTNEEKK